MLVPTCASPRPFAYKSNSLLLAVLGERFLGGKVQGPLLFSIFLLTHDSLYFPL